ncbi:MAG: HAMP domain-containing protein, partial [Gammaproteobacteria bacterium]|nr:HAMP domain-containing protein [Gammaproteobacteria bacterium]
MRLVQIAVLIISVLAGVMVFMLAGKMIVNPLVNAVKVSNEIADGNLTMDFQVAGNDEVSRLLSAMKDMENRLRDVVTNILMVSDNVQSGSDEISASA